MTIDLDDVRTYENGRPDRVLAAVRALRAERDAALGEVGRLGEVLRHEQTLRATAELDRDVARRERDALRGIVEGRTEPPGDAEVEAHAAAGGAWVVVTPRYVVSDRWPRLVRARAEDHREVTAAYGETWRWLPLDADGRVCAWPVVETKGDDE